MCLIHTWEEEEEEEEEKAAAAYRHDGVVYIAHKAFPSSPPTHPTSSCKDQKNKPPSQSE